MEFYTVHDPIRQRVNVYCELGEQNGVRFFAVRNTEQFESPVEVPMGAEPPIWDWYPEQVVMDLAEALNPQPEASQRHLDREIQISDRLLAMLERVNARNGGQI